VLETPMRILLGLLGAVAFGAGIAVAWMELDALRRGEATAPKLLTGGICVLAAVGGILLMRGAFRGRIAVHRPGHHGPLTWRSSLPASRFPPTATD
jgi:hypothetical protein